MSYPGNTSLAPEIQQRILATFEQTIELAGKGNHQEALLGCDFILRLDPLFDPARKLQSRLEQTEGSVDVSDLAPEEDGAVGETSFSDLENLSLDTQVEPIASAASKTESIDPSASNPASTTPAEATAASSTSSTSSPPLPESESPASPDASDSAAEAQAPEEATPASESTPASGNNDSSALASRLEVLLADRRFDEIKSALAQAPPEVQSAPPVPAVLERVQEAAEAEPYVRNFLDRAREAKASGDEAEASRLLDKARALDAEHPGIAEIEAMEATTPPPEGEAAEAAAGASQAPPQPSPSGSNLDEGIDLSAQSVSEDDDPRISELLKEGQTAFDQTDYQGAIDAWSRIFLIDIDHAEANRRIELARKMKAEGEREIEQIFHEALAHADAGETDEAAAGLKKVLELSPGHMAAREALEGLEAGETPAATQETESDSDIDLGLSDLDLSDSGTSEAAPPLKHQILVPPEPGEELATGSEETAPTTVAVKSSGARRRFFAIGFVVLAAVVVAGWFLYANRGHLFHNTSTAAAPSATALDPIAHAKELAKQGKTEMALSMLRRMPPSDSRYSEAQVLIAQWEAASKPQQPAQPTGPSAAELATRDDWLASARSSVKDGEFLVASEWLAKAASIAPLAGDGAKLKATCDEQLAPIKSEIDLFRQGEWELALPRLWRVHQSQPGNRTVTRLIVNSYYDLGVRDLQREEIKDALSKFNEAVKLAPADATLQRLVSFCETYRQRQPDLLYQIFVKYLPFR